MHLNNLNIIGICWILISIVSTIFVIVGFYLPYWLVGSIYLSGQQFTMNLGTFRRCNYPVFNKAENHFTIKNSCGRYATFRDIPSVYWQMSIVFIGCGCILSILLTNVLIFTCCIRHVISRNSAILVGLLQVFTGMSVNFGCLLYPMGWNNIEVKDACGTSATSYSLGDCTIGSSYVCVFVSSLLNLLCGSLSICSIRLESEKTNTLNRYHTYASLGNSHLISSLLHYGSEREYVNLVFRNNSALQISESVKLYPNYAKKHEIEECELFWPTRLLMQR